MVSAFRSHIRAEYGRALRDARVLRGRGYNRPRITSDERMNPAVRVRSRRLDFDAAFVHNVEPEVNVTFALTALQYSLPTTFPPMIRHSPIRLFDGLRGCIQRLLILLLMAGGIVTADEPSAAGPAEIGGLIDQQISATWQVEGIAPAPLCSDEVFVRRVYLDLVGRIPTMLERQTFLEDGRTDKRSCLIETLLASEDYVQHFADTFDTLLMGRGSSRRYEERQRHQWRTWLERVFRDNRPWNDVVADILLARPKGPDDRGAVWFLYERKDDYQKIAEAVAPAVFGIHIECAQCHDHMIATEIEQQHYWGLVAFFNRGSNTDTPNGPRVKESAIGGFSDFANLEGSSSPNLLTFFAAGVVEEPRPAADAKQEDNDGLYRPASVEGEPRVPHFSRREKFVKEVLTDHPLVARAFVNRIWAMLMGRGIVQPFDKIDSAHPASHPALLDLLADDFRRSGYNIRRLVQAVVLSRPYQLASVKPEGVENPKYFAWSLEKPLTAEQQARSIQQAVRGEFRNDDPLFGQVRDRLSEVMPEEIVTTVSSALFLTNNPAINDFISHSSEPTHLASRVLAAKSRTEQIDLLFLTLFSRHADDAEVVAVSEMLDSGVAGSDRQRQLVNNVIWAMLTSAEFRFNH
ncbi:MAG: DUF1549 domain-containing protein [Planctomycetaceae bacterium]|nr:DUF1549 domain-containing protein [Planctomycetaceae bacterium]